MSIAAASKSEVMLQAQRLIEKHFPVNATTVGAKKRLLSTTFVHFEQFKVDLHIRNHNTLEKFDLIRSIAEQVPKDVGHEVRLDAPRTTIVVVIFKVRLDFLSSLTDRAAECEHDEHFR